MVINLPSKSDWKNRMSTFITFPLSGLQEAQNPGTQGNLEFAVKKTGKSQCDHVNWFKKAVWALEIRNIQ